VAGNRAFVDAPKDRLRASLKIFAAIITGDFGAVFNETGPHLRAGPPCCRWTNRGDDLEVATTTRRASKPTPRLPLFASGSEVTLRSGHALCRSMAGRDQRLRSARFKLVKSAGAITLALDYGRVHPSLDSAETFTIYTPTIIATPISISGAPSDTTLGLGQDGEMCVLTTQWRHASGTSISDQSLIVPQGGTASLVGGQIESLHGDVAACSCDFPRATLERHPPAASPRPEISKLSHPSQPEQKKTEDASQAPAPAAEPVYTVLMPALSFDANSPTPHPDPSPEQFSWCAKCA